MGLKRSAPYGASERADGNGISADEACQNRQLVMTFPRARGVGRVGRVGWPRSVREGGRWRGHTVHTFPRARGIGRGSAWCVCAPEEHRRGYQSPRLRPNGAAHSQPMATPWDSCCYKPKSPARAPQNDPTVRNGPGRTVCPCVFLCGLVVPRRRHGLRVECLLEGCPILRESAHAV